MTDKNIFAYTANGADFPNMYVPYVSLNVRDGRNSLGVRSDSASGQYAEIHLTDTQLGELALSILKHQDVGADILAKVSLRLKEIVSAPPAINLESDAPLANACDLSGEGSCESCQ